MTVGSISMDPITIRCPVLKHIRCACYFFDWFRRIGANGIAIDFLKSVRWLQIVIVIAWRTIGRIIPVLGLQFLSDLGEEVELWRRGLPIVVGRCWLILFDLFQLLSVGYGSG